MIGAAIAKMVSGRPFECLNNKDIDGFMAHLSPNVVFHYPGNFPVSGKHVGKDAMLKWIMDMSSRFSEMKYTVKNVFVANIFALGPSNEVIVELDAKGKTKGGQDYANTYMMRLSLKGGKATEVREFILDHDASARVWAE